MVGIIGTTSNLSRTRGGLDLLSRVVGFSGFWRPWAFRKLKSARMRQDGQEPSQFKWPFRTMRLAARRSPALKPLTKGERFKSRNSRSPVQARQRAGPLHAYGADLIARAAPIAAPSTETNPRNP